MTMNRLDEVYDGWMKAQLTGEENPRRRELLLKGLGHGTVQFLRTIWFPAIGHFDNLHAEYEVRDMGNGYRYLDLAYTPGGAKGCIEIQGYRSHARDVEAGRFKDLCMKQALLTLDDWLFLPVAYLSIVEEPAVCRHLVLSFVGKFLSLEEPSRLHWAEAEALRFARRLLRPFTPKELALHLRLTERHTREVLRGLVRSHKLSVASGNQRYRTYQLPSL